MERMGSRWAGEGSGGLSERTLKTSTWDCIVMSTVSAEVMQPLSKEHEFNNQVRR